MAKQRRQKQKDASRAPTPSADGNRPDEGCRATTVRSQKLCVAVDIARQRIYGYTELTVVAPKNGPIGLHAHGLHIERVLVDGVAASFELLHQTPQTSPIQTHPFSSPTDAADACYPRYVAALDAEMSPELLIRPQEPPASSDASQSNPSLPQAVGEAPKDSGVVQPSTPGETKPAEVSPEKEQHNVVRVEYWVEKPAAGAHFRGKIFHTDNQLRRSRCWFPCVDSTSERCSFALEITVASEYIAVSNGKLLYQVYNGEDKRMKTYAYSLSIPITANYISAVVAPLVVLPDRGNAMITHMCMPGDALRLQSTVNFFNSLFSTYEEYLGAPFPFGGYRQVFLDSESIVTSNSFGASMVTLSSSFLVDERIIDQAFITQVKLAHALAQQWFGIFITPDTHADAWLLEGLAGFLCDQFVKRCMGNNEARYRRFKANEAVCMVDVEGAPALSCPPLYGTESLGALGQIRAWKAAAVVQMLEKQMGPEPFKKILQRIILRAQDPVRQMRTLSTKEFRHFANKLGNLERPFLKEFFPRWVESSGCPRLRMGFSYSKRRNMVELAIHRESTAFCEMGLQDKGSESAPVRGADLGWPGMMSIRIHELDGMYDHPSLPMAGQTYQLLDIQCHSKLAGRRVPKPKRGLKLDATDDNIDATAGPGAAAADVRLSLESPLLWLRADPQMEYVAEIHLNQPEQMWINQLEKDRDVVGQLQAIAALVALPRSSFAISNALNNCLTDSKVFCRVRIEAASALSSTATEANSWAGLAHLIKFYKSCRCDAEIGLPKSNDFHDLAEYLVLQAVPGSVAAVRGYDGKSPVDATDFILHILKHNDNSGNRYSDVFWIGSVIESIGGFEFGPQTMQTLTKFLKQIDRVLQYDRLMPSYNGVLTISCIHTLTCLAVKFPHIAPPERLKQLLRSFGDVPNTAQLVRVSALQSLLEIEARSQGLDSAMQLALRLVAADPSQTVQSKLMEHMIDMSSLKGELNSILSTETLQALVGQLETRGSFSNVVLRHHLFSLVQILAGRAASLYRKEKETTVVLQLPPKQKAPQATSAPPPPPPAPKEVKVQSAIPLKAKVVQQAHVEPIRIRVVPVRPNVAPKVEKAVANARSGVAKDPSKGAPRVGKVKLRLKPASASLDSASPIELSVGSLGAVTVSQSPLDVPGSVKPEPVPVESSQSRLDKHRDVNRPHVKEEVVTPIVLTPVDVEEGEMPSGDGNQTRGEIAKFEPEELSQSKPGVGVALTAARSSDGSDTKPVVGSGPSPAISLAKGKDHREHKKVKKEKDRKHKKSKKSHSRNKDADSQGLEKKPSETTDLEEQQRKLKRKAEKSHRKREKVIKARTLDVNTLNETVKVESNAVVVVSVNQIAEVDVGQKIRLKIKSIHTPQSRP